VAIRRNNLGWAWQAKGHYDKAIAYYHLALKSDLKNYGKDGLTVAARYSNLSSAWEAKGNFEEAVTYSELSYKIFLKKLDDDHPNIELARVKLERLRAKKAANIEK
jgi:tetratricopeptide (TPR) repeat protein